MNKILAVVERDMTLEAILDNFMVDLGFESKHRSVAGQACDVILRLVAPEFHHKTWNYYKDFRNYLKDNAAELVLFAYKDQRFGCLSRAAAVILYIKSYLDQWLEKNPNITNRLACLVRDFLKVEYIDIAFAVFATFGIQLIEPFFVNTVEVSATHSSLKFFQLSMPWFEVVRPTLLKGVMESYNKDVVKAVQNLAEKHMEQCIELANLMMPELRMVLARQRRDYNLSDEFEAEYPVEQQASNSDDTPVHNIGMERVCGLFGHRAQKLRQLEAVGQSIILDATGKLCKDNKESFRSFRKQAEEVHKLKVQWSEKMKERFKAKIETKQAVALSKEEKRLDLLETLKNSGGPFTNSQQIDEYLSAAKVCDASATKETVKKKILKDTQSRLKSELRFARESSTTLPHADTIFKIQVSIPGKKRRDKTAEEFGVALKALKALYGKRAGKGTLSLETFIDSLKSVTKQATEV